MTQAEYHRRSIRLTEYDYAGASTYFITLCAHERAHLFGSIENGIVMLTPFGEIVQNEWLRTPQMRPRIVLGVFVIMPNHFHAILTFHVGAYCVRPLPRKADSPPRDANPSLAELNQANFTRNDSLPTNTGVRNTPLQSPSISLGSLLAGFKAACTSRIDRLRNTPGAPVWQRNYWEHVVRDDDDLRRIQEYILANPTRWIEDQLYTS